MPRPVMLAGLLGAAVGVPYAIDHSDEWRGKWEETKASFTVSETRSGGATDSLASYELPMPTSPGADLYTSHVPLEGIATYSLADVLRMDISKDWVYSRWARKSTGLAEPELFGIRVPLVSGTRMTDVAGSLTYYFNVCGQCDKIRLTGTTANTSELVQLLMRQYGFQPQSARLAGEQLYQVRYNDRVASELRSSPESVLWTTSPHTSYSIVLEINRPGSGRFVEYPPPQLAALDLPPPAPEPLFGQPSPPGEPVFPSHSLVPTTEGEAVDVTVEVSETVVPKKIPPPVLRWPG